MTTEAFFFDINRLSFEIEGELETDPVIGTELTLTKLFAVKEGITADISYLLAWPDFYDLITDKLYEKYGSDIFVPGDE